MTYFCSTEVGLLEFTRYSFLCAEECFSYIFRVIFKAKGKTSLNENVC